MTLDAVVGLVGVLALILTLTAGRMGLASERYRLATTSERLALHYDHEGDAAQAIRYYTEFLRLVADQGEILSPRIESARQRRAELAHELPNASLVHMEEAS